MARYILRSSLLLVVMLIAASCKKDKEVVKGTEETPADSALTDRGWPRTFENNGSKLVVYQPQVDDWKNYNDLTARIAFSLTKDGKESLGVASIETTTLVDKEARQVYFKDIKINDVRFPSMSADSVQLLTGVLKELMPKSGTPIAVDRLLADIEQDKMQSKPVNIKNEPPPLFYSSTPAILLMIQGEPVLAPIEGLNLQYVVNANWDVFFDKTASQYYILAGNTWLMAKTPAATWTKTTTLPADMAKLPSGQNFDDVKKEVPPPANSAPAPKVFFSDKPAELVLTEGAPQFKPIGSIGLSYIANTDNDIIRDDSTQMYYLLLSGRWFAAKALSGPWGYAGNSLPQSFANIPENSQMGHVLSSVPGTQQANDAVMLAQIPTTAVVNKAEAEKKVKVHYDGDPQFKPIETTNLQYATNTQEKIIKDGDLYYLCFQGVWFMSTTANGPWKTASSVPKDIYTIPPSSPVYNVTYVTQTETSATTVVSQSTAGYMGMFVLGVFTGAVLTYGTGYYYPPYYYWGPGVPYPVYRPWPMTYGAGAVYNPWTGGYAAGRRVYGPYGAAGTSAWYNPATGRYGRSASVQGWYGGRTSASTYNPWTGGYAHTNQGHNPYAQWGGSVASRGNQWVQTGHIATRGGNAFAYRTSGGNEGIITNGPNGTKIHTNNGGLYAGHDGNVYRKNNDGSFSKYNKGNWNQVSHNTSTSGGLSATHKTAPANRPNQNLGGETRKPDLGGATRQQPAKVPDAERNIGGETRNLPNQGERNLPDAQNRNLGGETAHDFSRDNNDVMQGLHNSDAARQRGEMQTERFQNFHNNGGGGFSGGGFRGGSGRFGRH